MRPHVVRAQLRSGLPPWEFQLLSTAIANLEPGIDASMQCAFCISFFIDVSWGVKFATQAPPISNTSREGPSV